MFLECLALCICPHSFASRSKERISSIHEPFALPFPIQRWSTCQNWKECRFLPSPDCMLQGNETLHFLKICCSSLRTLLADASSSLTQSQLRGMSADCSNLASFCQTHHNFSSLVNSCATAAWSKEMPTFNLWKQQQYYVLAVRPPPRLLFSKLYSTRTGVWWTSDFYELNCNICRCAVQVQLDNGCAFES